MSIDSTWLRCPNCFHDLSPVTAEARTFGCDSGHRFDRAKHGYLTLLPPKAPKTIGDDPAMLRARAELLGSGAYAPIAHALLDVATDVARALGTRHGSGSDSSASSSSGPVSVSVERSLRIADLGCGTGHYSAVLAGELPTAELLLADRSPEAVRASLRALPAATGVVLDIWRPLPLRTASADLILNVFAPRNLPEFARVLRADGTLLIVVPTARHLRELRRDGLMLDIPDGKADRLAEQLAELGFALRSNSPVEYRLDADAQTRLLLADMGPAAHHVDTRNHGPELGDDAPHEVPALEQVTISVDVLAFRRATRTQDGEAPNATARDAGAHTAG